MRRAPCRVRWPWNREAIGELCRKYGVRSLVVFGSAVSEHFDDSRSDVDFLVEFADDLPTGSTPTSA